MQAFTASVAISLSARSLQPKYGCRRRTMIMVAGFKNANGDNDRNTKPDGCFNWNVPLHRHQIR
jgi:hypothetical protein